MRLTHSFENVFEICSSKIYFLVEEHDNKQTKHEEIGGKFKNSKILSGFPKKNKNTFATRDISGAKKNWQSVESLGMLANKYFA